MTEMTFLIFVLFLICIIIVCRELVCWYWKINIRINQNKKIIKLLENLNTILKKEEKNLPKSKLKLKPEVKEIIKEKEDCPRCSHYRKLSVLKCFECGKDLSKEEQGK